MDDSEYWYYTVELSDGSFTPGHSFDNVALTRKLLAGVNCEGADCFDFGTMEGLIPTLLAKRGAARVVAVDAMNFSKKVALVQGLHGVDFDYHGNVQLDATVEFVRRKALLEDYSGTVSPSRFDIVVASGILYHVFSPFHLLGHARSLVKVGGLVIVETAALMRKDFLMQYNFNGDRYIYQWCDNWFVTVPLLDYLLRYCKLAPLDCIYIRQTDELIRIAVACRAIENVLPDKNESLMVQSTRNFDYSFIVQDDPPSLSITETPYQPHANDIIYRPTLGTCDLFATCNTIPPYVPKPDEVVLRLHATV